MHSIGTERENYELRRAHRPHGAAVQLTVGLARGSGWSRRMCNRALVASTADGADGIARGLHRPNVECFDVIFFFFLFLSDMQLDIYIYI